MSRTKNKTTGKVTFLLIFWLLLIGLVNLSRISAADDTAGVFKARCAMCHGANGDGKTTVGKCMKIRDLRSDEVQAQSDAELTTIISKGRGKMPSFGPSLGPDTCKALVGFIRTLKHK